MSLSKIRVAVLRGGPSSEYDVSLATGAHVLSLLRAMPEAYEPLDIFISKDNQWHHEGIARPKRQVLINADVVFNALHGLYGEDGQLQRELESFGIPFTGSSSVASALSMDKEMTKRSYAFHSLLTPRHELVRDTINEDQLIHIFRNYLHPVIVKPANGGSSIGTKIAHTFQELEEAVKNALEYSKKVLVEEFIRGKSASCGVVENARGHKVYALIPSGDLNREEKKKVEEAARQAHEALGLRHYSDSDFVVTKSDKVYILETNSSPQFHADSHWPSSLGSVGWQEPDFVDHIIKLAIQK
jgi:D-alanine--D-alanine ligase